MNLKFFYSPRYIFNCLEDMAQINVPNDLEGVELIAEKLDRRAFVSILKEMLQLDQERRIDPDAALKHTFVTMSHLVDYAHLKNVQTSFQMMEVCQKKAQVHRMTASAQPVVPSHHNLHGHDQNSAAALVAAASQNAALMSNFLPSAMGFSGSTQAQLQQLNRSQELAAYAVPCHIQNAMTTPFYAAAAAAANAAQASRQHQMPAALSIFPTYQGKILRK